MFYLGGGGGKWVDNSGRAMGGEQFPSPKTFLQTKTAEKKYCARRATGKKSCFLISRPSV